MVNLRFNPSAIKKYGGSRGAYKRIKSDTLADIDDRLMVINVTSGGSGYTTVPTVTITGGGGTGAVAVATIKNGAVDTVLVTNVGADFTSAPTIGFTGGGGTGATATGQLKDKWWDCFYTEKRKFSFTQPLEIFKDSGGKQVASDYADMTMDIVLTGMQDDTETEEFIKDEITQWVFAFFIESGASDGNKVKERYYAGVKFERTFSVEEPGRRPEIKIVPQINFTAVTASDVPSWAKGTYTSFVVSAEGYYKPLTT